MSRLLNTLIAGAALAGTVALTAFGSGAHAAPVPNDGRMAVRLPPGPCVSKGGRVVKSGNLYVCRVSELRRRPQMVRDPQSGLPTGKRR